MQIKIHIDSQSLVVTRSGKSIKTYSVSTALNGPGELAGSEMTPRGLHYVRAKIGAGFPEGAVLLSRRPTGEIYSDELGQTYPHRDWILSRILWLCGSETGVNRGGKVDSMRRYIYIHGTPESEPMGLPLSHGCIRMHSKDVIALFDMIDAGTEVMIE